MENFEKIMEQLDGDCQTTSSFSALSREQRIQFSIAVSLKRIADMMKQRMEKEYPYSHGHRHDDGEMPF